MKLVVGLGNPGSRYAASRHNVGARVVERLAERRRIALEAAPFGDAATGRFGTGWMETGRSAPDPLGTGAGTRVGLLLPGTFMNESGGPVVAALAALDVDELLVAYDDVDLPFARLRLRADGGSGGHRGLADVMVRLEAWRSARSAENPDGHSPVAEAVHRLRFGVGRPGPRQETRDYVLQAFRPEEERTLSGALERAAEAIECAVLEGIHPAMDRFNAAEPEPAP